MKKVPIKFGNLGTVLTYLGMLYRSAADALKEHISNAIDEHLKALNNGNAQPICQVDITMKPDEIVIEYPYGMSEEESIAALQRVATSIRPELRKKGIAQIGEKGIGNFSVFHFGRKATFVSCKNGSKGQISFTIRDGADSAEFEGVRKRDRLPKPGIRVIISQLRFDPTKERGPLCRAKLETFFAEKFNPFLRDGLLKIVIHEPRGTYEIKPLKIELPKIGAGYEQLFVAGDKKRKICTELYYDSSGKATVSIRHVNVTVVENLKMLSAYGLEESVYTSGYVKGFIDADFLTPLPGRINFEENDNWIGLITELDRIRPAIEAEVEMLKEAETRQKLGKIQKKAFELVMNILGEEEFKDLELLEGIFRERKPPEIRMPPRGFDFIPGSVRIDPGETGSISLKAVVPKIVPNRTVVEFTIDNPSVEVSPKKAVLKATDGELVEGLKVATVKVSISAKGKNETSAVLTATAEIPKWTFTAEAKIHFAEPGEPRERKPGIIYEEIAFENGDKRTHSRHLPGKIQVNRLNPNYQEAMRGPEEEQMAYAGLMIFKETLAFNDKTGRADEFLEKMLSFGFRLRKVK